MNERLHKIQDRVRDRRFAVFHQPLCPDILAEPAVDSLSWPRRMARLTRRMCEAERAIVDPDEQIVFTRTLPFVDIKKVYSPGDWADIAKGRTLHESGPINNICPDWGMVLSQGLLGRRRIAEETRKRHLTDPQVIEFLGCAIDTIDAALQLALRYSIEAQQAGRAELVEILRNVPAHPPQSFHEALQSLRILHSVILLAGHYQIGFGRFDQYLWPYLKKDLDSGRLGVGQAEELLAEFFISLNKDSDLYPGVQPGDNGQTLTVGGVRRDGSDGCNELTLMVLRVARDVAMIDPKINFRISTDTSLGNLCLATELTRKGLGFPQYCNDDIVIPALVAKGYEVEDARDYTVAACWEFIIPGKGMEVVNIGAVSFPAAADAAIREGLAMGESFQGITNRVAKQISTQVENLADAYSRLLLPPAPFLSVFMDGCLEEGRDLSTGLKYNNFGIHGACSANAADALVAVKQFVFEDQSVTPCELLDALKSDYEGHESLRRKLIDEAPKVGKNSDLADMILVSLFEFFADACEAHGSNGRGGTIRPGTASAMYYMWLAKGNPEMREPVVGPTAEGRKKGDFLSANLSPSPGIRADGPFSIFRSFSKIDYNRVCNGGPITIELSDTSFQDPESIRKVAMLIRAFAQLGCQQLQLNALNRDMLLDARAHPEKHRDLIVRVWGWSGYFCELAPEYQEHIIARTIYGAG